MKKILLLGLMLRCLYPTVGHAKILFKIRGTLTSYTDKLLMIKDTDGKKYKFLYKNVVLGKDPDLSRMLNKERVFEVVPTPDTFPPRKLGPEDAAKLNFPSP